MPIQQRLAVFVVACLLCFTIFELVRKRRLREEYAWLWLLGGGALVVLSFVPFEALILLANSMGSDNPPAAVFFCGFIALILLCLQFSVRLSRLTEQVKNLGQQTALLRLALERRDGEVGAAPVEEVAEPGTSPEHLT